MMISPFEASIPTELTDLPVEATTLASVAGGESPSPVAVNGNTGVALKVSAMATLAAVANDRPSDTLARTVKFWYAGKATAVKMPMTATTINSSISVKP